MWAVLEAAAHEQAIRRDERSNVMPQKLSELELADACLSYAHDFGLLSPESQDELIFECKEWYHALRKTVMEPTPTIRAMKGD